MTKAASVNANHPEAMIAAGRVSSRKQPIHPLTSGVPPPNSRASSFVRLTSERYLQVALALSYTWILF
jgi:hypothetical protein